MNKKGILSAFFITVLFSCMSLNAADITGKVTVLPKGKPYGRGAILIRPLGEERFVKADIDKKGNYLLLGIKPGKYLIKMDLYGLTPAEKEIAITEEDTTRTIDFNITLSFLDKMLVFMWEKSDFIWYPVMVFLLLGVGILLTIVCRLIQVRRLFLSLKMVLQGALHKDKTEKEEGDISPYAALMTALAATVGNGNIAGVATAIATGGPGAPVWMWIAGFLGMATKYAEGFLGVRFRIKNKRGEMSGGH